MAASIHPGADGLEVGVPQRLFEFRSGLIVSQYNVFSCAVAPEGRFLVNVAANNSPPTVELISNWQKIAAAKGN